MALSKRAKIGGTTGTVVATIIAATFAFEDGWSNHPKDPGGETNHGITTKTAESRKADLVADYGWDGNMKNLTKDMAGDIYYTDYMVKPGFIQFADVSMAVTWKLTDSGVNVGPGRPALWLQQSLNSFSRNGKDYPKVQVDGKVGSATLQAYKGLQKKRGKVEACRLMVKALDGKQLTYYLSLNMDDFTTGWVSNRIGNVPLEKCNEDAAR